MKMEDFQKVRANLIVLSESMELVYGEDYEILKYKSKPLMIRLYMNYDGMCMQTIHTDEILLYDDSLDFYSEGEFIRSIDSRRLVRMQVI